MIEFKSSMFTHMMYDSVKATLRVRFTRGALYEYRNVPDALWKLFLNIRDANDTHEEGMGKYSKQVSVGSVLHWTIIANPQNYPFREINEDGSLRVHQATDDEPIRVELEPTATPSG